MNKRLISLIIAGLLIFSSIWILVNRDNRLYPLMVMDVTEKENLNISFLLHGTNSLSNCETTIATLARTVLAKCSNCRIKQLQCLDDLDEEQERQLSTAPLGIPSARMANGVVLFHAQDATVALSACETSERETAHNIKGINHLKCFPPDTFRIIDADNAILILDQFLTWQTGVVFLLLGATVFLLFRNECLPNKDFRSKYPNILQMLANLPRRKKQAIIAISDVILLLLSLWLAFSLRHESILVPRGETLWLFVVAPVLAIPVFIRLGLYRTITRYLGLQLATTLFKSIALYIALLALTVFLLNLKMPRSVLLAHGILTLFLIGTTRLVARNWFNKFQLRNHVSKHDRRTVLIYGAGSAGVQLASALEFSREMRPAAFIDDDPSLRNQLINGLVVHGPESLQELLAQYAVNEVLLAMPSTQRSRRNEIMRLLEPLGVSVRTLPGMDELAKGTVKIEDLREVDIEDLLGRDPVPADAALLSMNITGKAILVTGAGGSIGSELCRQFLSLQPKRLVLFERNEFSLYNIEQELLQALQGNQDRHPPELIPILGSVTDPSRLERVMTRFKIETVYHAAAYKHVPMVEKNPAEGAYNNIFGTWHAARSALATGVETFVLISTDKAVRPTNTMGTTKRFAEMILQALAANYPEKTRFTMVRFGNVLGSSGSVVPLFREQIRRGGPITVTDPRIIRYFMTIPESAQLVIQAGSMGRDGDVFVLDMGEPVKILDLAKRMVHLSGLSLKDENNPDGDIEIVFSGLRPGEKMYEELLIGNNVVETSHPRIMRANEESLPLESIQVFIRHFEDILSRNATDELRAALMECVKGFAPQCGNEDLLYPESSSL